MSLDMFLNKRLESGIEALSLDIEETARQRLLDYVALLVKWNRVFNLTAVRDPEQMIGRHLLDSLVLLPWLDESQDTCGNTKADTTPRSVQSRNTSHVAEDPITTASSECSPNLSSDDRNLTNQPVPYDLLDVGSGGGLPVIPLAIARPDLVCLSVETNGKKSRFQQQAALELGIVNLTVLQARIEQCTVSARMVTSRAFTAPTEFLAVAARHITKDGRAIVMLGQAERLPDPLPEPWQLQQMQQLQVPGLDAPRHLAICRMRNECSTLDA